MKFHRNTLTLEKDGSTRFSEWRTGYSCQTCPDFEVNFVRQSCLYPYIAHRHTHRGGPGLPGGKKDQLNCASSSMAPEFWGGWLIHVRRFELVERKINLLLPSIKPCKSPGNFIIASNQIIINFKLIRDFPTHIFCLAAAAVAHSHLWSVRLRFVLRGWQVAVLVLEEVSFGRKKAPRIGFCRQNIVMIRLRRCLVLWPHRFPPAPHKSQDKVSDKNTPAVVGFPQVRENDKSIIFFLLSKLATKLLSPGRISRECESAILSSLSCFPRWILACPL